jgi:hypothetical protein
VEGKFGLNSLEGKDKDIKEGKSKDIRGSKRKDVKLVKVHKGFQG